jgi:hypothetical protein
MEKVKVLPPNRKQEVLDFIDFLIWQKQKRNSNLSEKSDKSEIKNDYQS